MSLLPGRASGRTDIGLRREHNEDALLVGSRVCVVADGLGGHAGGEVAASLVVQRLADLEDADDLGPDTLTRAVLAAHDDVLDAAGADPELRRMGSTVVLLAVDGPGRTVAWVGDSRGYRWTPAGLEPLTRDDSVVADAVDAGEITEVQARTDPRRHLITAALGLERRPRVHLAQVPDGPGRVLLCSDGLTEHLDDDALAEVLGAGDDPDRTCAVLVERALAGGGSDNVTVVVVDLP